jgi:hypothetical protein
VAIISQRAMEHELNGPIDWAGGAKDKTGKKCDPYSNSSTRTIKCWRAEVRKDAENWPGGLENPTIKRQLAQLAASKLSTSKKQQTIFAFFKKLKEHVNLDECNGNNIVKIATVMKMVEGGHHIPGGGRRAQTVGGATGAGVAHNMAG